MRRLFILGIAVATLMTVAAGIATAGPAPKVDVCHRTGAGTFHLINISQNAVQKHIDHGDVLLALLGPDCGPVIVFVPYLVETVTVQANAPLGVDSSSLAAGSNYLFVVTGTWWNRNGLDVVDAECVNTNNAGWTAGVSGYDIDLLNLQVNTTSVNWVPVGTANGAGCAVGHGYTFYFGPGSDGTVNFRIYDGLGNLQQPGWHIDNSGSLTVEIYRVG